MAHLVLSQVQNIYQVLKMALPEIIPRHFFQCQLLVHRGIFENLQSEQGKPLVAIKLTNICILTLEV